MSSSVQVVVRLRPMNEDEKKEGVTPVVSASEEAKTVSVMKGDDMTRSTYSFNNVFTAFATQKEVFQATLAPIITDILKGYESTVFAYGQTGTGKTHTMEGDLTDPVKYGVIPRSADAVFRALRNKKYESFKVSCSYLEIYNEDLCDLFAEAGTTKRLEIMNNKSGTFCRGLIQKEVKSSDDVLKLMLQAQQSRKIGETKMNKHSSRSHCIFTVNVQVTIKDKKETTQHLGRLHMVDLAGSENAKNASIGSRRSATGSARERERLNINRSLLTLGRVIAAVKAVSTGKKNIRIPYRDSKLTRILQEALGGRCKTLIIATVSPSVSALNESISTLNYAQSANGIVNKPVSSTYHQSAPSPSRGSSSSQSYVDPTGAVEQWFELECKLKYMEAQIEESQLALARKEQQQQRIIDRAEKSERELYEIEQKYQEAQDKIETLEDELGQERDTVEKLTAHLQTQVERAEKAEQSLASMTSSFEVSQENVATLEVHLAEEKNRGEDLTIQLQNEVERAELAESNLATMTSNYNASQDRVAMLEDSLEKETRRCDDLTTQLRNTEDALMKTTGILEATRKTEQNLTAEAMALIRAVNRSIHDGDALYSLLEKARESDIQRRNATMEFNTTTANVLGDISSKISSMTNAEEQYRDKITENAHEAHKNDVSSLDQSQQMMQEVNDCVESLTKVIKALSLEDDGVLPSFTTMTDFLQEGMDSSKTISKEGEASFDKSMGKSIDQLQKYSKHIKSMEEKFQSATESLLSKVTKGGSDSKNSINTMATGVIESITNISNANIATRKELNTIVNDLQNVSLKVMKEVGRKALKQQEKTKVAVEMFVEGMKYNDELQEEVKEQLSYVNDKGNSQLEEISSQSNLLHDQKEALVSARKIQEKIQSEILTTVVNGVQELLSREINRLSQENESQINALTATNEEMSLLNKSIEKTTQNIMNEVEKKGECVLEHASELHENCSKMCEETNQSNETIAELKGIAKKHHEFVTELSKKTSMNMLSLEKLDEPIADTMKSLDADRAVSIELVDNMVLIPVDEGVQNLQKLEGKQINFVSKKMIPEMNIALNDMKGEMTKMQEELLLKLDGLKDYTNEERSKLEKIIEHQSNKVDELNTLVNTKRSDFEETILKPRRMDIETRHTTMMEDVENHYGVATEYLMKTDTLVEDVNAGVDTFAREEIHIDEEVPEMAPRTKIKFDENLSKTPSDGEVIMSLDRSFLKSPGTVLTNINNIENNFVIKESRNDSRPSSSEELRENL